MSDLTIGAMPYSFEGSMFEFQSIEQFKTKWQDLYDRKGTEEYSLEFLDGSKIEQKIYQTLEIDSVGSVDPMDLELFFEILEEDKIKTEAQAFAFEILLSHFQVRAEDALRYIDDVLLFEGTGSEYAEEFWHECFDMSSIPAVIADNVDWEKIAHDWECAGDIIVFRKQGFVLTNPHSVG